MAVVRGVSGGVGLCSLQATAHTFVLCVCVCVCVCVWLGVSDERVVGCGQANKPVIHGTTRGGESPG